MRLLIPRPHKIFGLFTLLVVFSVVIYVIALLQFGFFKLVWVRKRWKKDTSLVKRIQINRMVQLGDQKFDGLNLHTWEKHCRMSLEQLCNYPIFPKAPDRRTFVENLNIASSRSEVGVRVFGYLTPNMTGEYVFSVTSQGLAELWLSKNRHWKDAKKVACTKPSESTPNLMSGRKKTHFSSSIYLVAEHTYYFEAICVRSILKRSVPSIQIAWRTPEKTTFEIISKAFLTLYTNDNAKAKTKTFDDDLPNVLACAQLDSPGDRNKYMTPERLSYLESTAVSKALDFCEYRPSYILDPASSLGFKRYDGVVKNVHKMYSFPFSDIDGVIRNDEAAAHFLIAYPLQEQDSWSVVDRYMGAIEKTYPG